MSTFRPLVPRIGNRRAPGFDCVARMMPPLSSRGNLPILYAAPSNNGHGTCDRSTFVSLTRAGADRRLETAPMTMSTHRVSPRRYQAPSWFAEQIRLNCDFHYFRSTDSLWQLPCLSRIQWEGNMNSNYVFLCGVMWCQYGQQEAGSELMRALSAEIQTLAPLRWPCCKKAANPFHSSNERTNRPARCWGRKT